jgi:DNA repair exonuclease SbcCD nuclease subunit
VIIGELARPFRYWGLGHLLHDFDKNHKGRVYDTATMAAAINIAEERFICYVVVTQKGKNNRFYLHEIWTEKSLTNVGSNAAQRQPSHLQGSAKILHDIVSASDMPQNFFDVNGEPRLDRLHPHKL